MQLIQTKAKNSLTFFSNKSILNQELSKYVTFPVFLFFTTCVANGPKIFVFFMTFLGKKGIAW